MSQSSSSHIIMYKHVPESNSILHFLLCPWQPVWRNAEGEIWHTDLFWTVWLKASTISSHLYRYVIVTGEHSDFTVSRTMMWGRDKGMVKIFHQTCDLTGRLHAGLSISQLLHATANTLHRLLWGRVQRNKPLSDWMQCATVAQSIAAKKTATDWQLGQRTHRRTRGFTNLPVEMTA